MYIYIYIYISLSLSLYIYLYIHMYLHHVCVCSRRDFTKDVDIVKVFHIDQVGPEAPDLTG